MRFGSSGFAALTGIITIFLSSSTVTPGSHPDPNQTPIMPPVYLNHFFVVLSPEEFKSVRKSAFLKGDFAAFEERSTSSQNQSWSGLYYYGKHTYFEFLPVGSLDGQKPRDCSIALGVDHPGDSAAIEGRLRSEFGSPVDPSVIYRGDEKIPWFHLLLPRRSVAVPWFETWVMEYHKDFLPKWHAGLPPTTNSISREAILTRYKAVAGDTTSRRPHLFVDVESILIALPSEELSKFEGWLKALGFYSTHSGERTDFAGPDIKITVVPAEDKRKGILEASFRLSRPLEQTLQFGDQCVLSPAVGNRATWTFVGN